MRLDFPQDNKLWRIQWIDGVRINVSDYSNPLILVVLVEYQHSMNGKFDKLPSMQKRYIGVGRFPQLTIGSVWLNGEKVERPEYARESISVSIDGRRIDAGFSENIGGTDHYLLPPYKFAIPDIKTFGQSLCCLLLDNGIEYVLPNPEIARFYFATSSYTARLLFTCRMGDALDRLIYRQDSDLQSSDKFFVLNKNALDVDIKPISLIATSQQARNSANYLFDGLRKHGYNNGISHIRTFLPVKSSQSFQMEVEGIWLKSNRFLVFRILSSKVPYPQGVTSVDYARYLERKKQSDGSTRWKKREVPKLSPEQHSERKIQSQTGPRLGYNRQQFYAEESGFFPEIPVNKVKIQKENPNQSEDKFFDELPPDDEETLSTGAGKWTDDPVRGATVSQKIAEEPLQQTIMPAGFKAFFDVVDGVKLLEKRLMLREVPITSESTVIDNHLLSMVPLNTKSWTGSEFDRRYLAVVEFAYNGRYALFMEIQKKKPKEHYSTILVWNDKYEKITLKSFEPFISEMMLRKRWPSSMNMGNQVRRWKNFQISRFSHRFADTNDYSKALINRLSSKVFDLPELVNNSENAVPESVNSQPVT